MYAFVQRHILLVTSTMEFTTSCSLAPELLSQSKIHSHLRYIRACVKFKVVVEIGVRILSHSHVERTEDRTMTAGVSVPCRL
jgi:hypothetical protein